MSVKTYLGYPPANEVAWIMAHAQPAARAETRVWWSNDESDYDDYLIEGELATNSLDAYGKYLSEAYKVEIGSAVNGIGNSAFFNNSQLIVVMIPNSVRSIGEYAFEGCIGLTSVTIPNSVTNIGSFAFSNCGNLTSVTIGNGVTSIGEYAFYDCYSITNVIINSNSLAIRLGAFYNCYSLESIYIPNMYNPENIIDILKTANVALPYVNAGYVTIYYNNSNVIYISSDDYPSGSGSM